MFHNDSVLKSLAIEITSNSFGFNSYVVENLKHC